MGAPFRLCSTEALKAAAELLSASTYSTVLGFVFCNNLSLGSDMGQHPHESCHAQKTRTVKAVCHFRRGLTWLSFPTPSPSLSLLKRQEERSGRTQVPTSPFSSPQAKHKKHYKEGKKKKPNFPQGLKQKLLLSQPVGAVR